MMMHGLANFKFTKGNN